MTYTEPRETQRELAQKEIAFASLSNIQGDYYLTLERLHKAIYHIQQAINEKKKIEVDQSGN